MDLADPRAVRSNEALLATIQLLARRGPVEDIAVSELCRLSGVSRATFYRRSGSAAELLARQLDASLAAHRADFLTAARVGGAELQQVHRDQIDELAAHLHAHAEIYRNSLGVDRSAPRALLRRHLADQNRGYLDLKRAELVLPKNLTDQPWPLTRELLARNHADAQLALIEVWLTEQAIRRDPALLADWMMSLQPSWNRRLMDLGGGRV